MKENDKLCEAAENAASKLHADTSVNMEQTLINLRSLRDHVEILIEATESDIQRLDDE